MPAAPSTTTTHATRCLLPDSINNLTQVARLSEIPVVEEMKQRVRDAIVARIRHEVELEAQTVSAFVGLLHHANPAAKDLFDAGIGKSSGDANDGGGGGEGGDGGDSSVAAAAAAAATQQQQQQQQQQGSPDGRKKAAEKAALLAERRAEMERRRQLVAANAAVLLQALFRSARAEKLRREAHLTQDGDVHGMQTELQEVVHGFSDELLAPQVRDRVIEWVVLID